jgi:hypothetical protein
MVRVLAVVLVIVLWSVSAFCGGWENLKRDRDLLRSRAVEVADLTFRETERFPGVKNANQYDQVCDRILRLASESKFLLLVAEKVDKVVFGLEILGALLASGAQLGDKQYYAVVPLFDTEINETLKAIDSTKKMIMTIESRKLLQSIKKDLIDFWDERLK